MNTSIESRGLTAFLLVFFLIVLNTACAQEEESAPTAEPDTPGAPVSIAAQPAPVEETQESELPALEEEPIYLAIIWHQHQPVYFKDVENNVYERPWVRMHAAKDYVDMARILESYPDIQVTFNLTPSLIEQLDDLAAGAKDNYWVHTEIPAEDLGNEEKRFILNRFFDTNQRIIDRFPRYVELLAKRHEGDALNTYTAEDFRDLQVLFNLA